MTFHRKTTGSELDTAEWREAGGSLDTDQHNVPYTNAFGLLYVYSNEGVQSEETLRDEGGH